MTPSRCAGLRRACTTPARKARELREDALARGLQVPARMNIRFLLVGSLLLLVACHEVAGEESSESRRAPDQAAASDAEAESADRSADPPSAPNTNGNASPASPQSDAAVSNVSADHGEHTIGGKTPDPRYPECRFDLWTMPEQRAKVYICWLNPSGAMCVCDGTWLDRAGPNPAQCLDAIATVCAVDTSVRTYCEHGLGGGCWPSASGSDAWLCECAETKLRNEVRAASCRVAGETVCAKPVTGCEGSIGRCRPGSNGGFDCECPHDAPALHPVSSAPSCQSALEAACAPARGQAATGGLCSSDAGLCSGKGREPSDGFECQCQQGSLIVRQGKVVAPSCEKALAFYCAGAATK
jgi:hypothetical protein